MITCLTVSISRGQLFYSLSSNNDAVQFSVCRKCTDGIIAVIAGPTQSVKWCLVLACTYRI